MAKVNLDNRVKHLVGLSAKHIFKNLNKPLHKSWLASFSVRSHDRVDKCKIQFKNRSKWQAKKQARKKKKSATKN